jgi:glycosyltransferase involved in cell wall biosynthesis
MESRARILFVCPFSNLEAKAFVDSLAEALKEWSIKVSDSGFGTLLFQPGNFDLVHFFLPATCKAPWRIRRKQSRVVQTVFNVPAEPDRYKKTVFADRVVTFSEQERSIILKQIPDTSVDVILPCVRPRSFENTEPGPGIREKYDVQERLLVVALNDFSDQQHFSAFMYTVREYHRRGGFRFVIPLYRKDRQSMLWRNRLAEAIQREKLFSTTLLNDSTDIHSLIDAADLTLYMDKRQDRAFGFPLFIVEALCAGKPVLCYNIPPVNEVVAAFRKDWVANVNEDFSRISKDLLKETAQLEQISTELARFARSKMSAESVAGRYKRLYNSLLSL